MNRLDGFLALAALLVFVMLFIRATVFSGQQVRRMKWRTRLRMRPGAGFASHWEITFRFSRLAALSHGRRCRPDLRFTDRLICPACTYAVRLGRAQLGRTIYARGEDQVGIIAPQRTNKTGILADRVISVIRRHVLPGDTESAWAWLGRATIGAARLTALIALYTLRTVLAPKETATGLRRMVLDAAPVPGALQVTAAPATGGPDEPDDRDGPAGEDGRRDDQDGDGPAIEFATKKQAFLSRYRGHPQYGNREAASRVAAELAPLAGLQPGTGRTYIAEELKRIDAAVAEHLACGNLAIATSEGDR